MDRRSGTAGFQPAGRRGAVGWRPGIAGFQLPAGWTARDGGLAGWNRRLPAGRTGAGRWVGGLGSPASSRPGRRGAVGRRSGIAGFQPAGRRGAVGWRPGIAGFQPAGRRGAVGWRAGIAGFQPAWTARGGGLAVWDRRLPAGWTAPDGGSRGRGVEGSRRCGSLRFGRPQGLCPPWPAWWPTNSSRTTKPLTPAYAAAGGLTSARKGAFRAASRPGAGTGAAGAGGGGWSEAPGGGSRLVAGVWDGVGIKRPCN